MSEAEVPTCEVAMDEPRGTRARAEVRECHSCCVEFLLLRALPRGLNETELIPRASPFQLQKQRSGAPPRMLLTAHETSSSSASSALTPDVALCGNHDAIAAARSSPSVIAKG